MKLKFLQNKKVDTQDIRASGKRFALIDGFVYERSINLIWAKAGRGKTSFCMALAKSFCDMGLEVAYIDVDNGVDILQDRGYDKLIDGLPNLHYINSDYLTNPTAEIGGTLEDIEKNATKGAYENCAFFFDSLKFFLNGGQYDQVKINRFLGVCKSIRRAGGMVFVINHSLKNGSDMQGAQTLTDSVDEQWESVGLGVDALKAHYILKPAKKRMNTKEVGFSVCMQSFNMSPLDPVLAQMSEREREFVQSVKDILKKGEYNQNTLLKELGFEHSDSFGRTTLEKYTDVFWLLKKQGAKKLYTQLAHSHI